MEGIVGKECERQTLFITYNNCLFTSDSFGFFFDILAYISPIGNCWHLIVLGSWLSGYTHLNSLPYCMDACHYRVLSHTLHVQKHGDLCFVFLWPDNRTYNYNNIEVYLKAIGLMQC